MPRQWAVDLADGMKSTRAEFQRRLAEMRESGLGEDSVFVQTTSDIIDRLTEALEKAVEEYGIDFD
jgi:hypothetical protein